MEHITKNWGVHSPFNIEPFGGSFKIVFKIEYDHGKALEIKWTWLRHNLLVVLPWTPRIMMSEEALNIVPFWDLGHTAEVEGEILE